MEEQSLRIEINGSFDELLVGTTLEDLLKTDMLEPDSKITLNEKVIGEMTPLEKRLYTAAQAGRMYLKTEEDFIEAIRTGKLSEDKINQGRALMDVMWYEIRTRLNKMNSNIGIREGFKIVEY